MSRHCHLRLAVCVAALLSLLGTAGRAVRNPTLASESGIAPPGTLPIVFEPNRGQAHESAAFIVRGPGFSAALAAAGTAFAAERNGGTSRRTVRMSFAGGNARAAATGQQTLPGRSNYFIGNDTRRWVTNVPHYSSVLFTGVYPGIDIVYRVSGVNLKYDIIIAPGADPGAIRIGFDTPFRLDADGGFTIGAAVRHLKPVAFQESAGVRNRVACGYQRHRDGTLAFEIGSYDRRRALIIDPELVFLTYAAPGGDGSDFPRDLKVDSAGNVVVAGETTSTGLPVTGPAVQTASGGGRDIFVAVFSSAGALTFLTYLGGRGDDSLGGIALDSNGAIYASGSTRSADYPVTSGAHQVRTGGNGDIFLTVLRPGTPELLYSTFLGDFYTDSAADVVLDRLGNVYLTGLTASKFTTAGAHRPEVTGTQFDAFVAKFRTTPGGYQLDCATLLGGDSGDAGNALAIDAVGQVWVAGWTRSADFPITSGALRRSLAGGADAFVASVSSDCRSLTYGTVLGGQGEDNARTIETLPDGSIVVAGQTFSGDYPITANAVMTRASGRSGFVTRFHPVRSSIAYSTYIVEYGEAQDSAIDAAGNLYVVGDTSRSVPTTAGTIKAKGPQGSDAFVLKLTPDGKLAWGTYLGGSAGESASAIAVDARGGVYVAGGTLSEDFIKVTGSRSAADQLDAYIIKLDGNGSSVLQSALIRGTGSGDATAIALAVGENGNVYVGGETSIVDYPVTVQAAQRQLAAKKDALLLELSPKGDKVLYATYLGGPGDDEIREVGLDDLGNVYIAGSFSQGFPLTVPAGPGVTAGSFVAKLGIGGSGLVYARESPGRILAVERATGRVAVAGSSRLRCPVTSDAFQSAAASTFDVCVCQFSESGTAVSYATYLGGNEDEGALGLAVDAQGNFIITGTTKSSDFPLTADAFQRTRRGESWTNDAFITVLNPRERRLEFSTFAGGTGSEYPRALAVRSDGALAVVGYTYSPDFPVTDDAIVKRVAGISDKSSTPFLLEVSAPPRRLHFSTYLVDSTQVHLTGIGVGPQGSWVLAGWTAGQFVPSTPDALQARFSGGPADAFLMQLNALKRIRYSTYLGGSALEFSGSVTSDPAGNVYLAGTTQSPDFPASSSAVFRLWGAPASSFIAKFDMSPSPSISSGGIVSAASPECGLAPGSLFTVYGDSFAALQSAAGSFPLPASIDGVSVLVNTLSAPVTFAGQTQMNAQMPYEIPPGTASIRVKRRTVSSAPVAVSVNRASPCIFTQGTSRRSAAVNQDGTINSPASPARPGSVVTLYFTGQGAVSPAVRTGDAAPAEQLSRVTNAAVVEVGGERAEIRFLGLTPGLAGVGQANIRVPELPAGEHRVMLTIAGVKSNSPTLSVAPKEP